MINDRVIAIDLGSNTLRVLEWSCKESKRVAEFEKIVRVAEDLESSGKISQEAIKRVILAIKEAKEIIDFDSKKVVALTTEALRRAKNSKEVLELIYKESGVKFEIIDGKKEAILTLKAVITRLSSLGIDSRDLVLVDIGGGSTEVTFRFEEKILTKSFPIGIVTTAQKYKNLKELRVGVREDMKIVRDFINPNSPKPRLFVATAGTPTTIASIKIGLDYHTYDPQKINGTKLSTKDLDEALELLLRLEESQRAKLVGVGREDLIVAGVMIFREMFEVLGFDDVVVIDDGLREGIALAGCREGAGSELPYN